jgi:hypothetical protein
MPHQRISIEELTISTDSIQFVRFVMLPEQRNEVIMEDVQVPLYYTVKKSLTESEIEFVEHALRFTPVYEAIVINKDDLELAIKFCDEVRQLPSIEEALKYIELMSTQTGQPLLLISGTGLFEPYYPEKQIHEETSEEDGTGETMGEGSSSPQSSLS